VKWHEAKIILAGMANEAEWPYEAQAIRAALSRLAELDMYDRSQVTAIRELCIEIAEWKSRVAEMERHRDDAVETTRQLDARLHRADALAGADHTYDTARVLVANAKADLDAGRFDGMSLHEAELEYSRAIRGRAAALSAYRAADGGGRDG